MEKKKIISETQKADSLRLKGIYDAKKKSLGLTQQAIADALEITQGGVGHYLNGRNPLNLKVAAIFAKLLKVEIEEFSPSLAEEFRSLSAKQPESRYEIMSGRTYDGVRDGNEIEFIGGFDLWDDQTPLRDDEVKLPIYTDVELSAGVGSCLVMETSGRYIRFSKKTLRDNNVDKHAAACARVSGNSMEPVLADGTTVGIDTSKKQIKDGRLYAINHAGMLRIKLLYNMPGGGIRIRSYNMAEYPDETITDPAQLQQIEVVGFVFWWSTLNKW